MVWVRFVYDAQVPQMNFKPGDHVEVPDEVVRRWQLVWEMFILIADEMADWKSRGMRLETKQLPARDHRTGFAIVPYQEVS